jgi:hypothetical protein
LPTKINKLVEYKITLKSQITIEEQQRRFNKKWYPFEITNFTNPKNQKTNQLKIWWIKIVHDSKIKSFKSKLSHHIEDVLHAIIHMQKHMKNYEKYKTFRKTF